MEDNFKGGFRELDVWKEAREFRKSVSLVVKTFPDYEKYKLNNQLIRASRSVSANIAEGYGRFHYQENNKNKMCYFFLSARQSHRGITEKIRLKSRPPFC